MQEGPGSIPGSGSSPGEGIGYPLQYFWASLVAELVKNPPAVREIWVQTWVGKIPWRRTCIYKMLNPKNVPASKPCSNVDIVWS